MRSIRSCCITAPGRKPLVRRVRLLAPHSAMLRCAASTTLAQQQHRSGFGVSATWLHSTPSETCAYCLRHMGADQPVSASRIPSLARRTRPLPLQVCRLLRYPQPAIGVYITYAPLSRSILGASVGCPVWHTRSLVAP